MDTPDSVQRPSVGEGRREEGLLDLTLVAECERMGALIGDARIPPRCIRCLRYSSVWGSTISPVGRETLRS